MATVAPVSNFTQDPYKAPTAPTVPTAQTTAAPTPTPSPGALTPQPTPRMAAPTGGVPGALAQPMMDPLAFQPTAAPATPSYKQPDGNWDVSTQAGMDAMLQDRVQREASGYYEPGGGFYQPGGFGYTGPSDTSYSGPGFDAVRAKNYYDYTKGPIDFYDPQWEVVSQNDVLGGDPLHLAGITNAQLAAMSPEQRQATLDRITQAAAKRVVLNPGQSLYDAQGNRTQSMLQGSNSPVDANNLGSEAMRVFNFLTSGGTQGGAGSSYGFTEGDWRNRDLTPEQFQAWLKTPTASAASGGGAAGGGAGGAGGGYDGGGVVAPPGAYDDTGDGTASGLGPDVTPVDPENDLRSLQITPGAMLDRFKLAQDQYGTFADATSPQYQAALRDAARSAAATGRLGSGMLRTSYGDLANTRAQALTNERDTLFQNALLGSVQDAQTQFEDLMREQEYQTGAQNQAFNQAVTGQRLQEELTSGSFGRALSQLIQGYAGNPSEMQLTLSKIFGDQSSAAGQALASMMQGLGSSGDNTEMMKLLQEMQQGINQRGQPVTAGGAVGGTSGWPESPFNFPTPARQPTLPVS